MRYITAIRTGLLAATATALLSPLIANAAPGQAPAPEDPAAIVNSATPGVTLEVTATPSQQQAFLAAAGPAAQAVNAEYDIPASVTAGQAALESNWGTSGLSTRDKNYFGFKCTSPSAPGPIAIGCNPYQTTECTPSCHTVTAYFRVYASMTDSFRDYGRLLTTSSYYAPALPYRHNPDEFIRRVAVSYATDPDYAGKVITIMQNHNLYQLDSDPSGAAFHAMRLADGSWTQFGGLGMNAKDVAVASMPDGTAQVVAVGADDVVYHRVRNAAGAWTAFVPLNGFGGPAKGKRVDIAAAADGSAQVLITGMDGVVYHSVRRADGSWTTFGGLGTTAKDVAVAVTPNGLGHVVVVGPDDSVSHRVRNTNGSWTAFVALNGFGGPAMGKRVDIAAGADDSAQVVITGMDSVVYHSVRLATGTWTQFGGLGTTAKDVAVAVTPNGLGHVVVVGPNDVVSHRVRNTNGSWTAFVPLNGFGGPAMGKSVSIAGGADNSAQVTLTGV